MPRRAAKPKPGEQVHISFYELGEVVAEIDRVADKLAKADPHGRKFTRTDAVRSLLRAGLAQHK